MHPTTLNICGFRKSSANFGKKFKNRWGGWLWKILAKSFKKNGRGVLLVDIREAPALHIWVCRLKKWGCGYCLVSTKDSYRGQTTSFEMVIAFPKQRKLYWVFINHLMIMWCMYKVNIMFYFIRIKIFAFHFILYLLSWFLCINSPYKRLGIYGNSCEKIRGSSAFPFGFREAHHVWLFCTLEMF